ncbi:MAG TPA: ketopantoate reductase family protein [Accumulibacter sp.]|uniref:ketopantoate reductase family protein n=1 Tax=Accumulibacter sp. TaxID=2053492 RepID=UPI0025E5A560|nr:ketopantoate reductase family protein [Accumulibacter sp.]MCM8600287.1 ketopantoate reductase family protein [Accumulibacter sp.]MCM8664520.1 ketopantoate reductase family protein [Accumulibacter sp.]HNC51462.1 ketopantoate reductase family protein [Accumulibacter sp.]
MKMLFLGAGGVGGYFGGRLVEAGADVTFLVRPARAARLRSDGLRVNSPHGDFAVPVNCVTRDTDTIGESYDLVVLTAKAFDLADAIESVASFVTPATFVLPLLNGLSHMDVLDRRFGAERVLGGLVQVAVVLESDGAIRQLTPMHSLTAGGRTAETQAMAARFVEICKAANFDSRLSPDIVLSLWEKWVFLATLATVTTLMRASVGQIMETALGESLIRQAYAECLAVAASQGVEIGPAARAAALKILTQHGLPLTASMLRDLQAGQRTEHRHVLGDLLDRALATGIEVPILALALSQMEIRERESAAGH